MVQIFVFIFGLIIGSFLNVLIDRLSKEESIRGRSYCPNCRTVLGWRDLIPIFSFFILRGRCRYCRQKISWQYPTIELLTGLLFLFIYALNPTPYTLIYLLFITSCLIVIFVSDLKYYIIPDQIIYSAIGVTILYYLLDSPFLAALLASGFFLSLVFISKGAWMGLGDVKLAFLMGLILDWPKILIALFLSFLTGALVGSVLVVFYKKTWKSEIPFGAFLSASTLFVLFFGDFLLDLWKTFSF